MKLLIFIALAILTTNISAQATQLEVLKSWNFARQNPKIVANRILSFIKNGTVGPKGDESCYQEAYDTLAKQAAVAPLKENVGLDLAAYDHSQDMLYNIKALTHVGNDNSTVKDRINRHAIFKNGAIFYEIVAGFNQTPPVSGQRIVDLAILDCGFKDRPHRKLMFATNVSDFGA